MDNKSFVTYEQFGALGDCVTNDFAAIKATHDYANENGLTVKATEGKTYYISDTRIDGEVQSVIIKTDVDWRGASFIIDDSCFTTHNDVDVLSVHVFREESDYPMEELRDEKLFEKVLSKAFSNHRVYQFLTLGLVQADFVILQ